MKAVVIKKGAEPREIRPDFREMGTLRCDGCGEEFVIGHDPAFADKRVTEKQAGWREKVLAQDTSVITNTVTESNCRIDLHEPGPKV